MRRPLLGMLLCLACMSILVPASALAIPAVGEKDNGFSKTDERYLAKYVECVHADGCDYGRNLVDDGLASGKPPTDTRVEEAWTVMDRQLNPAKYAPPPAPAPAPVAASTTAAPATTSYAAPTTTSSGGCPSYMSGEASSPDAVNPSSGASGCYQVLPSTAAAMGSACSDVNSSSCVAAICESSGNGAWSSSGATPCDYVRP